MQANKSLVPSSSQLLATDSSSALISSPSQHLSSSSYSVHVPFRLCPAKVQVFRPVGAHLPALPQVEVALKTLDVRRWVESWLLDDLVKYVSRNRTPMMSPVIVPLGVVFPVNPTLSRGVSTLATRRR
ncbi:hypothetical protein CONPUDRAFT_80839 [Coniophora puteana RWD-64-598 SS2]|uniref:Uncharacterized protein n=1 Tax=Coniophora puteana (strain RWD-64-598) TaxID=741705 RepID=A0A5M3MZI9_CONPW|nr:uncharacterized protein CONPUDRAFT_80839 [Coniophora puteana RWD-64-598 SS2]EIW84583.1 hypothetical protein CONPUDRAFT_80839 [Coniophora puteana RWD-64-598 SS2]